MKPERFTLVLLDLTMPGLDGEEVFRRLRLIRPDARVVLMSGFNRVQAVDRFSGKGLAGFLQKPFTLDGLSAVMRRAFESTPPF
jgi:DNA-binding NtrC family response regulator